MKVSKETLELIKSEATLKNIEPKLHDKLLQKGYTKKQIELIDDSIYRKLTFFIFKDENDVVTVDTAFLYECFKDSDCEDVDSYFDDTLVGLYFESSDENLNYDEIENKHLYTQILKTANNIWWNAIEFEKEKEEEEEL